MISYSTIKSFFLDILFPPVCFACLKPLPQKSTALICEHCTLSIRLNTALTCPVCRARVPSWSMRCHKEAQYLLAAATSYEHPVVRALLWQLKFRHRTSVVPTLGELLFNFLKSFDQLFTDVLIVPMPLHHSRLRERGFNQAELIAADLSARIGAPMRADILIKIKKTKAQTEMKNWDARKANLTNCFKIVNPELVPGKKILLIDDVWTSGATMNEAVSTLKSAGARQILAVTLAKAG